MFKQRLRFLYYEWKCWFLFHHHMESLGKVGAGRFMYQCSFCFKRIVVRPLGVSKGAITGENDKSLAEKILRKGA